MSSVKCKLKFEARLVDHFVLRMHFVVSGANPISLHLVSKLEIASKIANMLWIIFCFILSILNWLGLLIAFLFKK